MNRDLTKGNVTKNLMYMAVPTMLGFMTRTLYDLVDMIWIGRISANAVAAVTVFSTVYWLAFVLNNIIGVSSISLISQAYGSGDMERTKRAIEQTFTFKAIMATIAAVIFYFSLEPLIGYFSEDPTVIESALAYGRIRVFFLPVMFSSFTVTTALRCTGDSKSPMYIMMFSALINIVLDPILMFEKVPFIGIQGFNMGVYGAALATVIATSASFVLGMWVLFSGKSNVTPTIKGLFKLNLKVDKQLLTIGLPTGVESLLRNLAQFFTLRFVAVYGTAAVAAVGIGYRVFGLAFVPLEGLLSGGSTIVGQCLGVNNVKRADATAKTAAKLGTISMSVATLAAVVFPAAIMRIFVNDAEVIANGTVFLRIYMPGLILVGIFLGLGTVFTGSGYNLPFMLSGMVGRWAVHLPLLYLVVTVWHLPLEYVVLTFLASEMAELAVILLAYKQGKWKTVRVGDPAMVADKTETLLDNQEEVGDGSEPEIEPVPALE